MIWVYATIQHKMYVWLNCKGKTTFKLAKCGKVRVARSAQITYFIPELCWHRRLCLARPPNGYFCERNLGNNALTGRLPVIGIYADAQHNLEHRTSHIYWIYRNTCKYGLSENVEIFRYATGIVTCCLIYYSNNLIIQHYTNLNHLYLLSTSNFQHISTL